MFQIKLSYLLSKKNLDAKVDSFGASLRCASNTEDQNSEALISVTHITLKMVLLKTKIARFQLLVLGNKISNSLNEDKDKGFNGRK